MKPTSRKKNVGKYEEELVAVAYPYWEAEAEIVKRFFKRKPGREDHIFWLKAQLWNELHPVDGYFSGLHRELSNLADTALRGWAVSKADTVVS